MKVRKEERPKESKKYKTKDKKRKERNIKKQETKINNSETIINPYSLTSLIDDAEIQLKNAKKFIYLLIYIFKFFLDINRN